jgi:hypothetical protein
MHEKCKKSRLAGCSLPGALASDSDQPRNCVDVPEADVFEGDNAETAPDVLRIDASKCKRDCDGLRFVAAAN